MQRGDIRLVDLDPASGSEAAKRRPAVIVSNNGANASATRLGRGVVTVVPLTSNVEHVFAFQALVPAGSSRIAVDSKAQAEQVRSIDVRRVGPYIGRLDSATSAHLDDALRRHLGL